jgi:glycosyltransferase involved in cell wall biosynthesis
MHSLVVIVPGRLDTLTGGYIYDRRIVAGLRDRGWTVDVKEIDGSFPDPTPSAQAAAARLLAAIPAETVVLIDGLAMGAMPDVVEAQARRLRIVALVHHPLAAETGIDPDVARKLELSERRALATARLVVVTSPATAGRLGGYDVEPARLQVVEPGTDRAPLSRGSSGDRVELLCVATLIPRKGHDLLLDALAGIPERHWFLSCVGSEDRHPSHADGLRARVQQLRLENVVEFCGEADAARVSAFYDRSDLFVLPTLYEGYGMAVAEALARGLPVITTTTGGLQDLVTNEAGILVPPGDVAALRTALSRVISDGQLRSRLAEGARRVRERLSTWQDASARMARLLEPLAAR